MNYVAAYNAGGAVFWTALALFIVLRYGRGTLAPRRPGRFLSGFLLTFSISDVIEIFTGAWRRPWGLLLLKAACVAGIAGALFTLVRTVRSAAQ